MNDQSASGNRAVYGHAFIWARKQLKASVQAETLVAGLVQQGWAEDQARQAVDAAVAAERPPIKRNYPPPAQRFSDYTYKGVGAPTTFNRSSAAIVVVLILAGFRIAASYFGSPGPNHNPMIATGAVITVICVVAFRVLFRWMSGD